MKNITVPKIKLLSTVRENRDHHREQFLEAQHKYRAKVIEELDKRLEQARNGGRINLGFALPEPVDYTSEYDSAIEMIEWEIDDEIVLSPEDFNRYVLNKWEWARHFAANTTAYLAGGALSDDDD